MSCQLRVPAISRTQKIHNVDVALKALAAADYQINGNITAKDIADGHREKTLSLLWQIIYKFRAPKFNQAAFVIQQCWRKCHLRLTISRRIAEKRLKRITSAVHLIQANYKGYIVRKWYKLYRASKIAACIKIQANVRRFLAMKNYKALCLAKDQSYCATKIQSYVKMLIVRREFLILRFATISKF